MYLTTLKPILPNVPPVPVIPSWITGQCVYGIIVNDKHKENFRRLHPNVHPWQSSSPLALISAASIIHRDFGCPMAGTTRVYHEGQWHVCLIHVDNWLFYPDKIADRRRSAKYMAAVHEELGITEEPQWYPCYIPCVCNSESRSSDISLPGSHKRETRLSGGQLCQGLTQQQASKELPDIGQRSTFNTYLTTLKPILPDVPPVPVIPSWITGKCVYGIIVNDNHRDHFRRSRPNVKLWQSSNPQALVSAASIIHCKGRLMAGTTRVYHEGQWHVCLIHVDNWLFYPDKIADRRRSADFMAAVHEELGITEEPQWYPCYIP